jgi:integrase/recombinase XerD
MTPHHKRLHPFIQRMAEDMTIRNLSPSTIDAYTWHVDKFCQHFGKPPEQLGPEEIRQYQLFLINEKKASWSSFNQAVCGLRFLYQVTLKRPYTVKHIPFGKKPKKLPTVLGDEEVTRLLACLRNRKHRTVLTACYAAGLRLSEATHLKAEQIDSQRMQIRVLGKGRKERLVPLSPRLLGELREYWKASRPSSYLFPGRAPDVPLSGTTIQKACKQAAADANINKVITPHTMRHSFATALLEAGVDLLTIGSLLGHKSFTTTLIYLHVRRPHLGRSPSPLDWLPIRQCPKWVDPQNQTERDNNPDDHQPTCV